MRGFQVGPGSQFEASTTFGNVAVAGLEYLLFGFAGLTLADLFDGGVFVAETALRLKSLSFEPVSRAGCNAVALRNLSVGLL